MPEDAEPTPRTGPALAVFAHPDDAEICAGGVLAKWASGGREVHLLILTNGDRGSTDPTASRAELAATRREETEAAAEVLGLPFSTYRRHLAKALEQLTDVLWAVEIGEVRLPAEHLPTLGGSN